VEASEETAVEASEEAVVEASEEAVMESSEETAVESSEETALEVLKEAALESSEEAVLESSEDTALEASKESEVEALEEVDRIIKHSSAIDDQEEAIMAAAAAVEAENAHLPPSAEGELARKRFQKTKCPPPETGNVLEPRLSFSTLRSVLATMAAMPDGALLESGLDEEEDLVLLNNSVTKLVWSNEGLAHLQARRGLGGHGGSIPLGALLRERHRNREESRRRPRALQASGRSRVRRSTIKARLL